MNKYNENVAIYLMITNIIFSPIITIIAFKDNLDKLFSDPNYISKEINKQMQVSLGQILCVVAVSLYSNIVKTYCEYTYDTWYLFYVKDLKEKNNKTTKQTHIYNIINQTNNLITLFTDNLPHISINIFLIIIPKVIKELVRFSISIYMTHYYIKNKNKEYQINSYEDVNLLNIGD